MTYCSTVCAGSGGQVRIECNGSSLPAAAAVATSVTDAIAADDRLSQAQKSALIQMYRTMIDVS